VSRHGVARRLQVLRRSLGLRLALLFLLLALAMTAVFSLGMQRALAGGWSALVRPLLADYLDRLAADLGSPPDVARAQTLVQRLPISIRIEGPRVQWSSEPERGGWRGRDFGPGDGRGDRRDFDHDGGADRFLERSSADGHRITFGVSAAGWERRPRLIGWATLGLLLGLTAVAYGATRRLFRPLDDIRAGVQRFGGGDFGTPIPQRRRDELGDLAQQVNTMAADLQHMLEAKRALLLAVSHELRSPLTRARLNAELVADGPARDALLRDLAAMRDLIGDLLEGERLASGHAALHREPTDLAALVRELLAQEFPGMPLQLTLPDALPPLPLDRMRWRLALRNLLDNARRHAAAAALPPRLRIERNGDQVRLTLRDFGPGVDPAQLPHLAEPFYRPDAARQRATGGVGLGLYLCRLVVQAHGGTLHLRKAEPGLEVELRLPMG
jgi:signal transduction histidine kinase